MNRNSFIIDEASKIFSEIQELRRNIHMNPELSFREYDTTKLIQSFLNENNIENEQLTETGVIGIIGDKSKRCIALRADIDALPLSEETNLDFASKNDGVMHACGHDMHTAMLLGASKILKHIENELNGCVKLIFQPAEEKLPGGASLLIEKGVLENPAPEAIFAQHINPLEESGKISVAEGPVLASTDEFYWTIRGKGAHAAQPHKANDPITTAAYLIQYYHSMMVKFRNPLDAGVLTVASINGGNTTNIFPEEVKMKGTLRAYNQIWRMEMLKSIPEKSKAIGDLFNTEVNIDIINGYPATFNDKRTTQFFKNIAGLYLKEDELLDFEPKMWAEDFAYYSRKIPGTFWFLGVKPVELDEMPMLHNPKLNPDEKAMINGVKMMAGTAYNYFNS
jgi:amidohydrolase